MTRLNPRSIEEKYTRFLAAWEDLAPDKSFGGMTLAQFRARIKPSQDNRIAVTAAENAVIKAIQDRDHSDAASQEAMELVVNGVRADPSVGGDDGALYKALGYVPQSEKKSGLTRKKKETPPAP